MATRDEIVEFVQDRYVPVLVLRPQGKENPILIMFGSGFLFRFGKREDGDADILITADHVVRPDLHKLTELVVDLKRDYVQLGGSVPGNRADFAEGEVLWRDFDYDCAVLKVINGPVAKFYRTEATETLPAGHEMKFAKPCQISTNEPKEGDVVILCGHHGSMCPPDKEAGITKDRLAIKVGTVVEVSTYKFRVDVEVLNDLRRDNLKGISGSAVFDSKGRVIGIAIRQEANDAGVPHSRVTVRRITAILDDIRECSKDLIQDDLDN